MRVVKPAEKYDVVSFAKAMNDDFAPKLKELFDTETAAAIEAHKTGRLLSISVFTVLFSNQYFSTYHSASLLSHGNYPFKYANSLLYIT